ncbi:ferredoxin [Paenibacillus wenxiniae]|uniref:Ferredoxin n=1 Tax=Paenibacillus wenxiniae TaxID=1636843 RepID=A0ABW4RPX2_9BACL
MKQYTRIEKERCIACGACMAILPAVFQPDEGGYAEAVYGGDGNRGITRIPLDMELDLWDAVDGCPTEAVRQSEYPFA